MTKVHNIVDCHFWHNQILPLTSLIITLDTTDYHTRLIIGPNTATKPPRYGGFTQPHGWQLGFHIRVQCIPIPKLPTPKSIVSEPSGLAKWGLWVPHAKWMHQMSGSHHSLILLGSSNLSTHYTPVLPVNHPFLNINLTIS